MSCVNNSVLEMPVSRVPIPLFASIGGMRPTDKKPTPGLASRLRLVRVEKHLTQEKLAQLIGVSKGAVSQWELGDVTRLGYERVFRLADVLSVEPRWLATGKGEKLLRVRPDPLLDEIVAIYRSLAQEGQRLIHAGALSARHIYATTASPERKRG